jgi:hypothetical protein
MNLVGKILTVVIVVMSLFFMALVMTVYATHKNWMLVVDNPTKTNEHDLGLLQKLKKAEDHNAELKDEYKKLEDTVAAEKAAAAQVNGKLATENEQTKTELAALTQKQDQLEKDKREAVATLKVTQDEIAARRAETEGLRADVRKANQDRDAHFKEVERLSDEMNQAANELKRLKDANLTLSADYAKAKEVLDKFSLVPDPAKYTGVPPAGIPGKVTAALGDGTIEINIGSDDGIMPKHRLEVFRVGSTGSTYVGRVEVVRTAPDKSVCKAIPETLKSAIQKGDSVTSKL